MFHSDEPIKTREKDLLNRREFSESVGDAILKYSDKDSIVLGLYGEWGSGKTSILNMITEHIEEIDSDKEDKNKTVIFRFSPWYFSGQGELIKEYFNQLSICIGKKDWSKELQKAGNNFVKYAKCLEPAKYIPGIGQTFGLVTDVTKAVANSAISAGKIQENDFNSVKNELISSLEKLEQKILIVIDDIDRLYDKEIGQIFQLVKCMGDLPNTIYLLLFDPRVVTEALSQIQNNQGQEYLEKIVQVPFTIPSIDRDELDRFFIHKLNEIISKFDIKFNQIQFNELFFSGLNRLYNNLRDIKRYINLLKFSVEKLYSEVNITDYIAITGIQLFYPEIYNKIKINKKLLTEFVYNNDKDIIESQYNACKQIFDNINNKDNLDLTQFFYILFPKIEFLSSKKGYNELNFFREDKRICSAYFFDVYFQQAVPLTDISQNEILEIFERSRDREQLHNILKTLGDKANIFFRKAIDHIGQLDNTQSQNLIYTLFDLGDNFPEDKDPVFNLLTHDSYRIFLFKILSKFPSREDKFRVIYQAISESKNSLYFIIYIVYFIDAEHSKNKNLKPIELRILDEKQLEETKQLISSKIDEWILKNRLIHSNNLGFILYRCLNWGIIDNIRKYIIEVSNNTNEFLIFLDTFIEEDNDIVAQKESWEINIDHISNFIEIDKLKKVLERIVQEPNFDKLEVKIKESINNLLNTSALLNEKSSKSEQSFFPMKPEQKS